MRDSKRHGSMSKPKPAPEVFAVEDSKFETFDAQLIATFKPLEALDIVIPGVTPQQVLDCMCEQVRWWEKKEPKATTTISSVREDKGAGRNGECPRPARHR
jgi:hypothetical protein